jgi:acyl carrier protein
MENGLETTVRTFVCERVGEIFGVSPADVSLEGEMSALQNFDSIKIYELILDTEKRFKVVLPDEDVFELRSLAEFNKFVVDRIRGGAPGSEAGQ